MRKNLLLFFLFCFATLGTALGQNITVKGTVLDENSDPVMGATVRLKSDATKGAITDMDGRFTLQAKSGETILITYVGYKDQEVKAAPTLTVRLVPDNKLLDEVVIVGYGTAKSIASTTASIVKVDAKDIESKPSPNVFDGLQGKVTGLQIYSGSGEPGQLMDIKLHGNGSLGLGSAPLYVLDGIPIASGTLQGLNPNDIESVQVLKDASATSIYGSRASNGVIYLTTKKGKTAEKARIVLSAQYGASSLANRNFYDGFLHSRELMDYMIEIGYYDKEEGEQILKDNPHDTNWTDYFYRNNAPTYNANLSISGGKGSTHYYLSGQHFYQEGLMSSSKYTKSNFRVNLNTKVNDWLTVSTNNALYYDNSLSNHSGNSNYGNGGIFYLNFPWFTPYKEDGTPYWDERIPGVGFRNPRYVEQNFPTQSNTFEYVGSVQALVKPIEGLTLSSRVGLDFSNYFYHYIRDPRYKGNLNNGFRENDFSKGVEWTFSNTAEYQFKLLDIHDITLLAGHEYNQYDGNGFWASGSGITDYRLMHLDNVTDPKKKEMGSSLDQYAYLSFFGRLSYGLLDRYYLDLTVRNDASSKFPKAHRNATFWSVGLKWNMADEKWMKDVTWINKFDLKASTGTAGNSSLGNYAFWALASSSTDYLGEATMVISSPGNPDLTWETQMKTTVGFDARLFNRLDLNVEYYHRLTTNMVMDVPYPYTSGVSGNSQNVGSYLNQGIDIHFDLDIWKNNRRGGLLNVYGNFNYNADKILSLFQGKKTWPMPNYFLMYRVGDSMNYMMPVFRGVDPQTGDPTWYAPGEDSGILTKDEDNIVVGNEFNRDALMQNTGVRRNAPVSGGFGLYASYYGFYLQADFSYYLGKYMINNDRFFFENGKALEGNVHKDALDFWRHPGDQVHLPDPTRYRTVSQFDTRMLEDASFLRLKSFTVGYDVPKKYLSKQDFFSSAKLYFIGRNLLTFTKFTGPDPEADINLSYGRNPATKQLSVGLELGF